jgi:ATP-dependent Clp protease ATP-binding subunit ClpA
MLGRPWPIYPLIPGRVTFSIPHLLSAPLHPLSQPQSSSVHRYFPLADSFLEIRQFGTDSTSLEAPTGLDQSSYRRLVVCTCMPQFAGELIEQLETLFPEDPMIAEHLLYDLCVEVNPGLDINRVQLRGTSSVSQPILGTETWWGKTPGQLKHLRTVSRGLERKLKRSVHGQEEAIHGLCESVQRAAAGLAAPNRPLGSFLFVGRTGTGKTELARRLAKELAEDGRSAEDNLFRIDCSEYALAHEYSKLLGSPPGYVGHEEGGQFTKTLAKHPRAVILFDEIEKAHPRMHNLLLQILEEGCLTDGQGQRIQLNENFVLMTSNAGAADIRSATRPIGFQKSDRLSSEILSTITDKALGEQFSAEFLGRIDRMIVFKELDKASSVAIAQDQLTQLAIRARQQGVRVAFTGAVARWVAERGYSAESGARELRSVIQHQVEPPLARVLLSDELLEDDLVRGRIKEGALSFFIEH